MQDDMILHNIGKLYTFPGEGPVPGTMMDSPSIIEGAAVTVSAGKIHMVAGEPEVWDRTDLMKDAVCIDCKGKCLVPGFVDPHTHLVFAGTREYELPMKLKGATYLDILNAGGGILRTVKDTRAASLEELVEGLDLRLDKMLRYGTTTVEIKSGYGLDRDTEIKLLKTVKASKHPIEKVPTFLGPHAVPPEFRHDPNAFIDLMIDVAREVSGEGLAEFADIFCETGAFDEKQSRRFLSAARDAGLKVKVHSDEIMNLGGTIAGADLGASSADHLLVSDDHDLDAMKEAGTVPVLLPGTLLTIFEQRVPRAREMMDRDLPVAIATDINPNCMVENLQFIMALACYRLKMTPNEILAASTVNAAHAIGRSGRKGRIREGYDADLLVMKDHSFEHVVYNFGVNHVEKVILGGKLLLDNVGW
ncbi:MAG: imidazolonepropionase [Candidatus Thermoplasmatota archaeon]|nr:imidazolonepropionase [Candidatus Thermoplasmatota archaeon]